MQPAVKDEDCRAMVEELRDGASGEWKVRISCKGHVGRKIELAREPRLDFVKATGDLRKRRPAEHAHMFVGEFCRRCKRLRLCP